MGDPLAQSINFVFIEPAAFRRGRHLLGGVGRIDPPPKLAFLWLSGDNDRPAFALRIHSVRNIEPQISLSLPSIRTVTRKAMIGQNWPDVAVEFNRARRFTVDNARGCEH